MAHGQAGAEIAFGHGPTLTCNHEAPIVAFDCKGSQVQHDDSGATPTLRAMAHADSHANAGGQLAVAHALRAEGFDASEDGTGRGTPIVPVAMPLTAGMSKSAARMPHEQGALIPVSADGFSTSGDGYWRQGVGPLRAREQDSHENLVAFDCLAGGETALAAGDVPGARHGVARSAVAFDLRGLEGGAMPEGPHDTANMRAASGGSSRSYIAQPWAVRRLTPRECERLQGFPDDFTRIPWGARKRIEARELLYVRLTNPALPMEEARRLAADGPRYKALGNSWAVNCAEWIGERIESVEGLLLP